MQNYVIPIVGWALSLVVFITFVFNIPSVLSRFFLFVRPQEIDEKELVASAL